MIDQELAKLFARGTAAERDARFAARVEAEIRKVRSSIRLPHVAVICLLALALAAALYLTGRTIAPGLARIAEYSPDFMGVPVPLVLATPFFGVLLRVRRYLFRRVA